MDPKLTHQRSAKTLRQEGAPGLLLSEGYQHGIRKPVLCFLSESVSKEDSQEGALTTGTRAVLLAMGDPLQTTDTGLCGNFPGSFTST